MSGRSCRALAIFAALCGIASVSLVLHWDRAVAKSPLKIDIQSESSPIILSGSQPSCQDQKSQGPDIDVWDVAKVPINWLTYGIVNAIAFLSGFVHARLDEHGNLGFYEKNVEDTYWVHGLIGVLQSYCIVFFMFVVFLSAWTEEANCAAMRRICCRAFFALAVYLAVIYAFVFLLMFLVYPIFVKLEWFHLERAILFCIPLSEGESTPISQYIILPYVCYWLYLLFNLRKSKADFDQDTLHYNEPFKMIGMTCKPLTKGQASIGFAALDFVTDMYAFVVNMFLMPWWWSALWFVSLLVTCFIVWHVFNEDGRWRKITVKAKTAEDASQFILAIINAVIAVTGDLKFDQYTIYAGIASLLGMLTSFKKWYVGAGVDNEQEAAHQLRQQRQQLLLEQINAIGADPRVQQMVAHLAATRNQRQS